MVRSKWGLFDGVLALTTDNKLLKIILVEGDGPKAGRGAKVAIKYSLRLSEELDTEPFDSSSRRPDGVLEFTLGRRKVIPALEIAAQNMKLGEKCRVKAAANYAFGSKGLKRKGVPPDATVYLEVEMIRFEGGEKKKPFSEMTPSERFEMAKNCKEQGNSLFKELKYDRAMTQYSQCIQYLANVFLKSNSSRESPSESDRKPQENTEKSKQANGDNQLQSVQEATTEEQHPQPEQEEGFEEAQIRDDEHQTQNGISASNTQQGVASDETQPDTQHQSASQSANVDEEITTLDISTATTEKISDEPPPGPQAASSNNDGEEGAEAGKVSDTTNEANGEPKTEGGQAKVDHGSEQKGIRAGGGEESGKQEGDGSVPSKVEDTSSVDEEPESGPTKAEVASLHVTTLNNLSLCLLKLEQYKRAVESASLALNVEPSNSKALYYRYVPKAFQNDVYCLFWC